MSEDSKSFIGKGWSFPPEFSNVSNQVIMLDGAGDIQKSLEILLSTRQDERVMKPDYGCNLEELLFEPLTTTFKTHIQDLIRTAILYYEPRIDVNKIDIDETGELNGKIIITIDFTVRSTNSRFNFVYPFYKNELTQ